MTYKKHDLLPPAHISKTEKKKPHMKNSSCFHRSSSLIGSEQNLHLQKNIDSPIFRYGIHIENKNAK